MYPHNVLLNDCLSFTKLVKEHLGLLVRHSGGSLSYLVGHPWYLLLTMISITFLTICILIAIASYKQSHKGFPRGVQPAHTSNLKRYQERIREPLTEPLSIFITGGFNLEEIEASNSPHVKNIQSLHKCLSHIVNGASLYRNSITRNEIRHILDGERDIDTDDYDDVYEAIQKILFYSQDQSVDWDILYSMNKDKYRDDLYKILRQMETDNPFAYMTQAYANRFSLMCRIDGKPLNEILRQDSASEAFKSNTASKSVVHEQNMYKDIRRRAQSLIQMIDEHIQYYELKKRINNPNGSERSQIYSRLFETTNEAINHCKDIVHIESFNTDRVHIWITSLSYWMDRLKNLYIYSPHFGYWHNLFQSKERKRIDDTTKKMIMTLHWLTNRDVIQSAVCAYLYLMNAPISDEERHERFQRIAKSTKACAHTYMYLSELKDVMKYRAWRTIDRSNIHKYILDGFIMQYAYKYWIVEKLWKDTVRPTALSLKDDFKLAGDTWDSIYSFISNPRNIIPYMDEAKGMSSGEEGAPLANYSFLSIDDLISNRNVVKSCSTGSDTPDNRNYIEKYAGHKFMDVYSKNALQFEDEDRTLEQCRDKSRSNNIPYYATDGETNYQITSIKGSPASKDKGKYAVFKTPTGKPPKTVTDIQQIEQNSDDNGFDVLYSVEEETIGLTYTEACRMWFRDSLLIKRTKPNSGKFVDKATDKKEVRKERFQKMLEVKAKEKFNEEYPQFYIESFKDTNINGTTFYATVVFRDGRAVPDNEQLRNSLDGSNKPLGKGEAPMSFKFRGSTAENVSIISVKDRDNSIKKWIDKEREILSQTVIEWARNKLGDKTRIQKFAYQYETTRQLTLDAVIDVYVKNPSWDDNWRDLPSAISWAHISGKGLNREFKMEKRTIPKYNMSNNPQFGKKKNPNWRDVYETTDWSPYSGVQFDGEKLITQKHDTPEWIVDRTEKRKFTINVNGNHEYSIQKAGENGSGNISQYNENEVIVEGFIMKLISKVINIVLKPITAMIKFVFNKIEQIITVAGDLIKNGFNALAEILTYPIKLLKRLVKLIYEGLKIILDGIINAISQIFGKIGKLIMTTFKLIRLISEYVNKPLKMFQIILGGLLWIYLYTNTIIISIKVGSYSIAQFIMVPFIYSIRLAWSTIMSTKYIMIAIFIAALGMLAYIIDVTLAGGYFTRTIYYTLIACENDPDSYIHQPYAHRNNMYERGLLCSRPCSKGYSKRESMWCFPQGDEIKYCPQSYVLRASRGVEQKKDRVIKRTNHCHSMFNPQTLILCQGMYIENDAQIQSACYHSHCTSGRWQPFCTALSKSANKGLNFSKNTEQSDLSLYTLSLIFSIGLLLMIHSKITASNSSQDV